MAFCVFHENKDTPALSINLAEGIFHCKNPACDMKGDVFTFYMRVRSITFREAVNELARRCGIPEIDASAVAPLKKLCRKENMVGLDDYILTIVRRRKKQYSRCDRKASKFYTLLVRLD